MKTYVETQGQKPFDWYGFLERAIKGDITPQERVRAISTSFDWVTCACGNLCDAIPRDERGRPEDGMLAGLGGAFHVDIRGGDYQQALSTLHKIEERSAYILSQMSCTK